MLTSLKALFSPSLVQHNIFWLLRFPRDAWTSYERWVSKENMIIAWIKLGTPHGGLRCFCQWVSTKNALGAVVKEAVLFSLQNLAALVSNEEPPCSIGFCLYQKQVPTTMEIGKQTCYLFSLSACVDYSIVNDRNYCNLRKKPAVFYQSQCVLI